MSRSRWWWLQTKNDKGQDMILCCHSLGNAAHHGKEGDGIAENANMLPLTHVIYKGKARRVRA